MADYIPLNRLCSPKEPNWLIEVLNWLPTTLIFWKKVILIGLLLLYIWAIPIGITYNTGITH